MLYPICFMLIFVNFHVGRAEEPGPNLVISNLIKHFVMRHLVKHLAIRKSGQHSDDMVRSQNWRLTTSYEQWKKYTLKI